MNKLPVVSLRRAAQLALGQFRVRPVLKVTALATIGLGLVLGIIIHFQLKWQKSENSAKCMLLALTAIPGVSDPVLGYVRGADGTAPTLKFSTSDHANWSGSTICGHEKPDAGHFCFMELFIGSPTPDAQLERSILARWKNLCGEDVKVELAVD